MRGQEDSYKPVDDEQEEFKIANGNRGYHPSRYEEEEYNHRERDDHQHFEMSNTPHEATVSNFSYIV
jgi:hypothetical protein